MPRCEAGPTFTAWNIILVTHDTSAQTGWSCHSDAVQPVPTSYSTLQTAAWTASPRRSEEALLRSCEGNLEVLISS